MFGFKLQRKQLWHYCVGINYLEISVNSFSFSTHTPTHPPILLTSPWTSPTYNSMPPYSYHLTLHYTSTHYSLSCFLNLVHTKNYRLLDLKSYFIFTWPWKQPRLSAYKFFLGVTSCWSHTDISRINWFENNWTKNIIKPQSEHLFYIQSNYSHSVCIFPLKL